MLLNVKTCPLASAFVPTCGRLNAPPWSSKQTSSGYDVVLVQSKAVALKYPADLAFANLTSLGLCFLQLHLDLLSQSRTVAQQIRPAHQTTEGLTLNTILCRRASDNVSCRVDRWVLFQEYIAKSGCFRPITLIRQVAFSPSQTSGRIASSRLSKDQELNLQVCQDTKEDSTVKTAD